MKSKAYQSDNLKIEKISEHTYIYISYLNTTDFGKVPCNGMIVFDNKEALIIDTPTNDVASAELIKWVKNKMNCEINGVIITHYHTDNLGGLAKFHKNNIASYASNLTIKLAKQKNKTIPQKGFDNYSEIKVGNKIIINEFLGEGHTVDNIVSYFPSEKVLFGGCLIKSDGASKGNLADADVNEWSNTVKKVKSKYGDAKIIIPGHGKIGEENLLDYTIALFKIE